MPNIKTISQKEAMIKVPLSGFRCISRYPKEKKMICEIDLANIEKLNPTQTLDKIINNNEAWFWSKEWQESEHRADKDFKAGRYTVHDTPEDLVKSLKKSVCKS